MNWAEIELEILAAFKNVRLDGGVGYYEAGAREKYLSPESIEYEEEKKKDAYDEWTDQLIKIRNVDFESGLYAFMDAKGLYFYLPFLLMRKEPELNDIMLSYISDLYKRYGYGKSTFAETYKYLTDDQKKCILHFYEFMSNEGEPFFLEEELNADFDTGEEAMKGFDYMTFMMERFG